MSPLSKSWKSRPLSSFEAAALGVRVGRRATTRGVTGSATTGEVNAPAYEVSNTFAMQSYFDSDLQERAILAQPPNQPIVPSTQPDRPIMTAGYGLALTPGSQCPVAVQFFTGGQQGRSATYRLKPGEVIYPFGRPGEENGQFSGFTWGLPFGWLGGGSATLIVLRTADARVTWPADHNEVIYHRIRLPIWIGNEVDFPAAGGVYTGPLNWPQRFPWTAAMSGANSLTQRGRPGMAVFPTRTALSLVNPAGSLVNASTVRLFFVGANDWIPDGVRAAMETVQFTDIVWGSYAPYAAPPAPFATARPQQILTGEIERIAADAGAVVCVADPAGDLAVIDSYFIDFVRYGRL